jgi:hypothetical protein
MRIIITGGTGFIGKHLAANLAGEGHDVIILTRSPHSAQARPVNVRMVGWDAKSAEGWGHLVDGAGAIVNLAGEGLRGETIPAMMFSERWTPDKKRRILQSRLDAGKAIIEAISAASKKPGVVIQSSAVGIYGPRQAETVTEQTNYGSDFLAEVCQKWEDATSPVEKLGVRRAIIRTGIVLSAEGGALPLQMLPFKLFAGGPVGSGKQYHAWIHQDDEIAAIRFLIENERASGAFNLTAPAPVTNAEFGRTLAKVISRPYYMPAPSFALKLAFGETSSVLLTGQKVMPVRLRELGFEFQFSQLEPALRHLLRST